MNQMKVKDLLKLLPTLPQDAAISITLYDLGGATWTTDGQGKPITIGQKDKGVFSSSKNKPESTPAPATGGKRRGRAAKPATAPGNPNVLSDADKKKRTKRIIETIKSVNLSGGDEAEAVKALVNTYQVKKEDAVRAVSQVSKKYKLTWGSEDADYLL